MASDAGEGISGSLIVTLDIFLARVMRKSLLGGEPEISWLSGSGSAHRLGHGEGMGRKAARGLALAVVLLGAQWLAPLVSSRATGQPPVVLIVMENHSFGPNDLGVFGNTTRYIMGNPDAPYINQMLIPSGTLFTNYDATYHPSLPNYLQITSGSNEGCTTDDCRAGFTDADNLFNQMNGAGLSFASWNEAMATPCQTTDAGLYAMHHNPEPYYSNLAPTICPTTDVSYPSVLPASLPAFTFLAPNLCDDMHGTGINPPCPRSTDQIITTGDTWLSQTVPALLSQGAIVIVTFDEGTHSDTAGGGGHVLTEMVGPGVTPGTTDSVSYTHASLLAGLEQYFGLPLLADASSAVPLPIPAGGSSQAPPVIDGFSPAQGPPGTSVTITGPGFTGAEAVQIGGASAAFSVTDDADIVATVPRSAVTGPITVVSQGGTATSTGSFTVLSPPPPVPPVLVQHAATKGRSSIASVTWPQATSSGDLLVATLGWTGGGSVTPPSGWRLASQGGTNVAIFYQAGAPAQTGSGSFTLSVSGNWVLGLTEWSNVASSAPLDAIGSNTSKALTGTIADSGPTLPTSQPIEVAIAALFANGTVTESAPTNGFALTDIGQAKADTTGQYTTILSATGPQQVSATLSAAVKWRGAIATFRAG